jgi:hypothetical protein
MLFPPPMPPDNPPVVVFLVRLTRLPVEVIVLDPAECCIVTVPAARPRRHRWAEDQEDHKDGREVRPRRRLQRSPHRKPRDGIP